MKPVFWSLLRLAWRRMWQTVGGTCGGVWRWARGCELRLRSLRWTPVVGTWIAILGLCRGAQAYYGWVHTVGSQVSGPLWTTGILIAVGLLYGPILALRRQLVHRPLISLAAMLAVLWMVAAAGTYAAADLRSGASVLEEAWRSVWTGLDARHTLYDTLASAGQALRVLGGAYVDAFRVATRLPGVAGQNHPIPEQAIRLSWWGVWAILALLPWINRWAWRYILWAPPSVRRTREQPVPATVGRRERAHLAVVRNKDPRAFDSLVGVDKAVQLLVDQLAAWSKPDEAARFGVRAATGLLLYGPPGTGKTSLARAAAKFLGVPCEVVTPDAVLGQTVGDTERRIHAVFTRARQNKPSLVFIDEIDCFGRQRDGQHRNRPADLVLPVLLQELDGFEQEGGVLVIAATNRPAILDEALHRRFSYAVEVGLPDHAGVVDLLRRNLRDVPYQFNLAEAASRLGTISPADAQRVCQALKQTAWRRYRLSNDQLPLSWEDFVEAIGETIGVTSRVRPVGWSGQAPAKV